VTEVRFFFDFLSPYSCLALLRAEAFEREHSVAFALRPVPLGTLLNHHEIKGAGVVPAKRAYVAADIQRVAELQGVSFPGPPIHPFMSFDALRLVVLFREDPRCLELCRELARECWCEGADLADREVLARIAQSVGLDGANLDAQLLDRDIKRLVRAYTAEALELGVFGVPTFAFEDELFWGQDRMDSLAARIDGKVSSPLERAAELLARGLK